MNRNRFGWTLMLGDAVLWDDGVVWMAVGRRLGWLVVLQVNKDGSLMMTEAPEGMSLGGLGTKLI